MFKANTLKYRGLFISTTIFIVFFIVYLFVNYTMQRNTIYDVEYENYVKNIHSDLQQKASSEDIYQQLLVLQKGGDIARVDGSSYRLEPIDKYIFPALFDIQPLLMAIGDNDQKNSSVNMTQLYQLVIDKKERSIKLLHTLQVITAILMVLLYFIVIVQVMRQLSNTDTVAVQSKNETENIMNTIGEGLFLLDSRYDIGAEQSKSLKKMFKSKNDLEGNFLDFISHYVTQNIVELAQEYLQLLFGERVKERLIEELNPLKEVEVNIVRRDGSYESYYLDFTFNRVLDDKKISHLLCSVKDVTKQVLLARQLIEAKEAQEAQLDMLKSILHIDSNKLNIFFTNVNDTLQKINQSLEAKNKAFSDIEIRLLLNDMLADIHQIKGDAAVLGLHKFEFAAHDLEEIISKIKKENRSITGKELLPVTTGLRAMFTELDNMNDLVHKFADVTALRNQSNAAQGSGAQASNAPALEKSTPASPAENTPDDVEAISVSDSLKNLTRTVSERNDKQVILKLKGLDEHNIPQHLLRPIQSVAIQFIRNSIVHGIEPLAQRQENRKEEVATIKVVLSHTAKGYILSITDDGQGIDDAEVLEKAVSRGIISQAKADNLSPKKLTPLLFHSEFSRMDNATIDGGRGVGLHLVKKIVDDVNGKMNVNYEKGVFCQFKVLFPHSTAV